MNKDILEEPKEFMEATQDLLISILDELRETIDIISHIDSKRQGGLQDHILRYYRSLNKLSNLLNSKIDSMKSEMEFNVNATIGGLMLENQLRFKAITGLDLKDDSDQNMTNVEIIE